MCGRFALFSQPEILEQHFECKALPGMETAPRWNIAPSQTIAVVRQENGTRRLAPVRWGLIPGWAKDGKIGYNLINARAETVAHKPAFRNAFRHRRCLIPADGFYEWQVIPGAKAKQPWFIALRSRLPMALAGLWETWQSREGTKIESCTIIVTEANDLMRPIHDRMPVILPSGDWSAWLETADHDAKFLQNFLKPYLNDEMTAWKVNTSVNSPRNDTPECIEASE
ncbi:SOS response-associated peptidase [Methylomicrobium sp. RS1]|uniref:SOS response-associated peptidase n=1 Tax=Candidatus Methylomicrobium oryzae TaxID=2802053 RepID=UPI0019227884|nr:SOS response-associated peptidase [Methylomicrobium sp. RS1]MBL1264026.1 SOS response-associated peptidase [Methylomicrobium sp. RS1]